MIKKMVFLLLLLGARVGCASNYYVDCNYGSNGNAGTSPQTAWRTLLEVGIFPQVNGGVGFQPGDTINLKRDCTWNETLTPPSSGTNPETGGALIKIDSYGNGQPPHLTGYMPIAAQWWQATGNQNVWSATLYSTTSGLLTVVQCGTRGFYCLTQAPAQLNFVRFGTVWGVGQATLAAVGQDRDWWYDSTNYILYVYSASGNPATHYGNVAPIVLSGQTLLNLNGLSWLEIQHLQIDWFDGYGVQVQATAPATSDHIWLANIAANSDVENGAVPLGFYVHPNGTPTDIHLYNTDANMNYVGYHFDDGGAGGQCSPSTCAFEIKNCRAYGNRAYGIVDNVGGAVSYDYCHLYANNLATAVTVDTSGTPGPTAGTHNIAAETPPWVREWRRWPAYTTVTFDDPGLVEYSDSYINALLPMLAAKRIPLSIAVVTGGSYSQSIVSEVQGWIKGGWDVNTHSISHEYWDPPAASCGASGPYPVPCHAFENLQYTGNLAASVKLTISHSQSVCGTGKLACLTVTTSPDDLAADIFWDLTPAAPGQAPTGLDTLGGILYTLQQRGVFSVSLDGNAKSMAKSISLADVTNLDIFSSAQNLDLDETQMETEEMSWAQTWMNLNFTGLPSKRVYVMPGTYEDPVTEEIAAGLGYAGVRGTGSLKPCCGANTTLASGYDVFNILSQGIVPNYQGLSYQQMRNRVSQDLFKNALWGRPIGYFWHVNELRPDEVTNFADALVQGGAALESNTGLVNFLLGCTANDIVPQGYGYVPGSFYVCPSSGVEADFRPTVNSPVPNPLLNLGATYQYDLMGTNRNLFAAGWEMGAYAYVPESVSAGH
ncbi:MAG: hypothetical protein ABSG70_06175 [Terriglobales bacterium]|jgi:hypothetical protein